MEFEIDQNPNLKAQKTAKTCIWSRKVARFRERTISSCAKNTNSKQNTRKKAAKMSTKSETLKRSKTIKSLEDLALRKFLKRFLVTVGYETFHKKNEELYDFLEPVRLYLHRTNKFSLAKKWILELMFENGSWISVRQAKKNWTNGHFIEYWLWYYFAHIHTSELVLPDVLTCGTNLAKSSAKVNVS